MQIGIRAHDIHIFDNPEKLAISLKEHDFHYVQFAPRVSLSELTHGGTKINFGLGNQVKQAFDKQGIKIAVLGCYINIIDPDLTKREQVLTQFKKYLSLAHSFGTELVATETGSVDPTFRKTPNNFTPIKISETINVIHDLVTTAEKTGTLIGIEPGVNHPIYSLEVTKELLQAIPSPNLQIILDPGSLIMNPDDDPVQILKRGIHDFGERIYAYHIKDYIYHDNHIEITPIGAGQANIESMLQTINAEQPNAYVIADELSANKIEVSLTRLQTMAQRI
ncbi:sugar phosphate isomerase/epimerase family protein [Lactiplantibacillus paraplantarum]|uniref:sugar phosphate isomerase/epimerase family protein n=1 Tax=Lactiplantibacillus paraplantarum TaxID=60520 RepID=UPI0021D0A518|nr:sugar phosphate isomerase/epimerase [Lactiplantibacillus paraplantarum]MCU4685116.1 sugar phosphate isomerase/epimerase [Lactiplantibacillus paraplantarum]